MFKLERNSPAGSGSPAGQAVVYKAMNVMAIVYPKFAAPIPSLIELQITYEADEYGVGDALRTLHDLTLGLHAIKI
jgi:hypothetical protein